MGDLSDGLLGLAAGDALGVNAEGLSRQALRASPVTGMEGGGGMWGQAPGTWSDDTSLAFALADSLSDGLDFSDILRRFSGWLHRGDYTARGETFGVGRGTAAAIARFDAGTPPLLCGGTRPEDNGNGSLMRILPLAGYLYRRLGGDLAGPEALETVSRVSSLTHAHLTSRMGCGIYVCIAGRLLDGESPLSAVRDGTAAAFRYYEKVTTVTQRRPYDRVWDTGTLCILPERDIRSSCYVADTLEAALWCFLTTDSYRDCVLKAVNLGGDTDTTAAVAGGLAGIAWGADSIPAPWLEILPRREELRAAGRRCGQ